MARLSPAERFQAKSGSPDARGCRPWLAARNRKGYGSFGGGDGRTYLAHRWLLGYLRGVPLGPDELALHHCDNPGCVAPDHLYVGTAADNNRDAVVRGRAWTPLGRSNAAKTHCPAGHPYDDANTLPIAYGPFQKLGRACRTCRRERQAAA